jgi:hypothetical protein
LERDILTGESSANNVCWEGLESSDVIVAGNARPVLGEDSPAIGIDFAELDGSHASSFEPKTESSDAAE